MARNLRRFPPKPLRSANFIRSLAGSEPGLRMNTMGELGVLCSKMASKLIMGGCTYLVKETKRGLGGQPQRTRSPHPEPTGCSSGIALHRLECLHSRHTQEGGLLGDMGPTVSPSTLQDIRGGASQWALPGRCPHITPRVSMPTNPQVRPEWPTSQNF